jgi:hypothetical protein
MTCPHGNSYPPECVQCAHDNGWNLALEEAAKVAETYAATQDGVAKDKALDAPMSSLAHEDLAYAGRAVARAIRALKSTIDPHRNQSPQPRLYTLEEVEKALQATVDAVHPKVEAALGYTPALGISVLVVEAFRAALEGK